MSEPNMRCPKCGYEMWVGPVSSPVEVSMLWFCPADGTALDRMDVLGEIERLAGTGTFDDFVANYDGDLLT